MLDQSSAGVSAVEVDDLELAHHSQEIATMPELAE